MYCKSLLSVIAGMIPFATFALPKTDSTILPLPTQQTMQQGDKSAIDFVVSIPVYQDSSDNSQYYYVPKFKASVNAEGIGATFIKNEVAISSASQISDTSIKLSNMTTEEYFNVRKVVTDLQNIIDNTIKTNPRDPNLPIYQEYLRKAQERQKTAENNAAAFEKSIPSGVLNAIYSNISTFFASAGIQFPLFHNESIIDRQNRLSQKLVELSSSNGGLITGNIYAGFTADELTKIKTYKANYAPFVKISVVPVTSLVFESLTELQYDANGVKSQRAGIPIFASLKGGGTLTGATFNFDLTTNGAVAFARNLPPFIPPIAIKGVVSQQIPVSKGNVTCNFGAGMVVKDRNVINQQVAVFNDNTLSNLFVQQGQQQSPCQVTVQAGDKGYIQHAAQQEVEQYLGGLQFQKSYLSPKDKGQYWQQVQQTQVFDRTTPSNGYQNVFQAYQQSGWGTTATQALVKRPNYYWQSQVQDVSGISGVKFQKDIVSNAASKLELSIPTSICFVWNVKSQAYRACSEGEFATAKPLTDATQSAKQSQSCITTQDAVQCGINRNTSAPTSQDGNILPEDL
ncbi:hypothetical protein [Pigmentibacter ruber]|uniref:hypothetical protein n=1 Tax=Pigmentibacter ruber TaxID=2683196 RepID=UPI00131CD26E|nr:hypothetical protein [Pigmentibacter ruber]